MKRFLTIFLISFCLLMQVSYAEPISLIIAAVAAFAAAHAIIASIATAVIGGLISTGIGMAVRALSGKPKTPALSIGNRASKVVDNVTGTVEFIPVAYGRTKLGGIKVYTEVSKSNLYQVVAFCEGEINAFKEIYIDDTLSTDDKYKDQFEIWYRYGSDTQDYVKEFSDAGAPEWGEDQKGRGIAYVCMKFKKNTDVFPRIPIITCVVEGTKVFDPRLGNDPNVKTYSNNNALCILDYLLNKRYGKGLDWTQDIDPESFIEAANYFDVQFGSEARVSCNGFVDTGRQVIENIDELLASCNASLIFTGGKHKLVVMKPETAVFDFNRDNILGALEIERMGKKSKFNRIEIAFMNPETNWQGDLVIIENQSFLLADRNEELVNKMDLAYITSAAQASRVGEINLRQSRLDTKLGFKSTLAALAVECGDVVTFNHPTPGWVNRLFRVVQMSLEADSTVGIQLEEYDDDVYTSTQVSLTDLGGTTTLNNPFKIDAPGVPAITQTFQTTTAGDVKNVAHVEWTQPVQGFILDYELSYKAALDTEYTKLPRTKGLIADIYDIPAGTYDFRVRAFNTFGTASDYAEIRREIFNNTASPADVTGFRVITSAAGIVLQWDKETQAFAGGRYVIKYNASTDGAATWYDLDNYTIPVTGKEQTITLALIEGTYMIKAENLAGIQSSTAQSIVIDLPDESALQTVITVEDAPTFSGTKTNTVVSSSKLRLDGAVNWDSLSGDMDDVLGEWDSTGGLSFNGSYKIASKIDLGAVYFLQLEKLFQANFLDSLNNWDVLTGDWDNFPGLFDGDNVITGVVTQYYSTTEDDPASPSAVWTPFQELNVASLKARGIDINTVFSVTYDWQNIEFESLGCKVKMKARNDFRTGISVSSSGSLVNFNKAFYSDNPTLHITITNASAGDSYVVSTITKSGFNITCYNSAGTAVNRNISYNAFGIGEAI